MWAQVLMASLDSGFCFVFVAFTTWVFSATLFLMKLVVGADLGDVVLEPVGDLDLEGPNVDGRLGLGGLLRPGSLLNLGLLVRLHVNVVLGNCR
jgi:hypothetical protein